MISSKNGTDISEYEITGIEKFGIWLPADDREYFIKNNLTSSFPCCIYAAWGLFMNKIAAEINEKLKKLPEPYQKEILDFVDFIEQKSRRNTDTVYLQKIPGMTESIKKGRKEKTASCRTLEDIGWK